MEGQTATMKSSARKILILAVFIAALGVAGFYFSRSQVKKGRNVILVVFDTTRADHLSLYGYERQTSPFLDEFGKSGIVFDRAVAVAPWTPPAVASMMTGLYPFSHGLMPPNGRQLAKKSSARLDEKLTTLAEIFQANGYKTGGVTPNPWVTDLFGFSQGFEKYYVRDRARADEMNRAAFKVMDEWATDERPFFFFMHYLDPHGSYDPPPPFRTQHQGSLRSRQYDADAQKNINLYDGEISFLDTYFKEFIGTLKQRGIYDDTLILVVGDHGEQFDERGHRGHGFNLFNEEVHVPLIIHDRDKSYRVDYTVSNVDVAPTLLDGAGIAVPANFQGVSLFNEEKLLARKGVVSEIKRETQAKAYVSFDGKKIIYDYPLEENVTDANKLGQCLGVFDPKKDVFEVAPKMDQASIAPMEAGYKEAWAKVYQNKNEAGNVEVGDDTLEKLKSMGYMK